MQNSVLTRLLKLGELIAYQEKTAGSKGIPWKVQKAWMLDKGLHKKMSSAGGKAPRKPKPAKTGPLVQTDFLDKLPNDTMSYEEGLAAIRGTIDSLRKKANNNPIFNAHPTDQQYRAVGGIPEMGHAFDRMGANIRYGRDQAIDFAKQNIPKAVNYARQLVFPQGQPQPKIVQNP
jgi:hypothetical protein